MRASLDMKSKSWLFFFGAPRRALIFKILIVNVWLFKTSNDMLLYH